MGLLIYDSIEIPQQGISLSSVVWTIKGDYVMKKSIDLNKNPIYNIKILLLWYASQTATLPIYQEERFFQLQSVDGVDIYTYIYTSLKNELSTNGKNSVEI